MNKKLIFILIISLFAVGILVWWLLPDSPDEVAADPTPILTPSPTPTPPYFAYISRPANYVGKVESLNLPQEISLMRDDQSKIVLQLEENIPIYLLTYTNQIPQVTVSTVDQINIGETLSVYTEDKNILAIFVQNAK